MKRLGIKYQILLITLIPILLIDIFFTYTYIESGVGQATELLQSKGRITAKQIASASEFSLISGQDQQIQYLLDQTIDTDSVILISVYNQQGTAIAKAVSEEYLSSNIASYFYYRNPVTSHNIAHSDVFTPEPVNNDDIETIGWVNLYISRKQLDETTAQITQDSVIFFIIVLLLSILMTFIISQRITQPVFTLLQHLRQVEAGQLGDTINLLAGNEIGTVQKGFNRMTRALLSNQKQLNSKIQQATLQLSEAIAEMEVKNQELGLARDEAQKANNIKSEFLANISHEIRTPINGIKGFISLISQSNLSSTQKKYADIILKSTNDLTSIINEVLDFSKLESGKLQIIEDEFDLHKIIEQVRDSLFISILAKNIDLILIIYSDTPRFVGGDKLRIKQVLLNLIGNAIKFTDDGEVVIRVSVEDQSSNDTTIQIAVEDTGIGISEEHQASLFTAFSQVETAANRRFTGSGLGLAISKNLVGLMGGEITLQSKVGEGSTFTIRLPLTLANTRGQDSFDKEGYDKTAIVIASRKTCLQELQSMYDRAGITTEPVLLGKQPAEQITEIIHQKNNAIDYLVVDFRHLNFDIRKLQAVENESSPHIIAMHYDPGMIPELGTHEMQFVSIINSSSYIRSLLDKPLIDDTEQQPINRQASSPALLKKVLFVDDNEVNLKLGSELIRLSGHQVYEAQHADEAMNLYRNKSFDLIILDIQMPDIDGVKLRSMMREERPDDRTPIVALTANILNDEAERLLNLGFDYYLAKPIDIDKFQGLLHDSPEQSAISYVDPVNDDQYDDIVSIDFEKSLDLAANNESLLRQIFEILLREIPQHKIQISNAVQQLDYAKLSAIAHKIHGVTCYACLPRLKSQVISAQQQISEKSYPLLETTVDAMVEELEQIGTQIDSYLQQKEGEFDYPEEQKTVGLN